MSQPQELMLSIDKSLPLHLPDVGNFMLYLMEAVNKDQTTLENQQITDANTTKLDVQMESNLYQYWIGKLTYWANQTYKDAGNQGKVAADQAMYKEDSAKAQAAESQQDGGVQAAQGQTSADASNLQMKAQMVQGVNSILTTLSNLLGRVTA